MTTLVASSHLRAVRFVSALALAAPGAARGCAYGSSQYCSPDYSNQTSPDAPWAGDGAAPERSSHNTEAPPAQRRCYVTGGAGPLAPPELLA